MLILLSILLALFVLLTLILGVCTFRLREKNLSPVADEELSRQQQFWQQQLQQKEEHCKELLEQQTESSRLLLKQQQENYESRLREQDAQFHSRLTQKETAFQQLLQQQKQEADAAQKKQEDLYRQQLQQQKQAEQESRKQLAATWELSIAALREQLKTETQKTLEERTAKLDASNENKIKNLLAPFQENLKQLQDSLKQAEINRSSIGTQVSEHMKMLQAEAKRMATESNRLSEALHGTNRAQGAWGEYNLEQALNDACLEKDVNYFLQYSFSGTTADESEGNNELSRPDAAVQFPDGRMIFVDSKVSLTAYLKYTEMEENDPARKTKLKEHVESIRRHFTALAKKKYPEKYQKISSKPAFEYTVMFMPCEAALTLALNEDHALWQDAFEKKVILISRMTLFPLLWLIRMCWSLDRKNRNEAAILKLASLLADRMQNFVEELAKMQDGFRKLHGQYQNTVRRLSCGSQSVIATADRLRGMIGKEAVKKSMNELLEPIVQENPLLPPGDTLDA